VVMTLGYKHG